MAKMYYKEDADISLLKGKRVGIIGYGSQGHAARTQPARQRCGRDGGPARGQRQPCEG